MKPTKNVRKATKRRRRHVMIGRDRLRLNIRWLIRRDMPQVTEIEKCLKHPMTEDELITYLKQRNTIGMVAETLHGEIAALMLYTLFADKLCLLHLAVHPDYRRYGCGTALVDKLKSKLYPERRNRIEFAVPDDLLDVHLFLRSQDFFCYEVSGYDYLFEFREDWK